MSAANHGKPHVFVGSSGEQLRWSRAIQVELDYDAEVTVWPQGVFKPSRSEMTSLVAEARRSDFAIFVFAPDDIARMRTDEHAVVRDNVIFELGLFIGELGQQRCFIFVPRGETLHLPTDLVGMAPISFEPRRSDGNLQAAVGPACHQVRTAIQETGPRSRPPFPHEAVAQRAFALARHAEAAGLTHTYVNREEAFPDITSSIAQGGRIRLLSNKGNDWLGTDGALSKALEQLRNQGIRFDIRTLLLHIESPWLKKDGLRFLRKTRQQVIDDFSAAHAAVEQWCSENNCEAPRYHRHYPAWRFVQTERALFISTYVTNAQIAAEPVMRFAPESSIYRSVNRYFDFLYENYSAPKTELSKYERYHDKPVSLEASAGIVMTRGHGATREVLLVKRPAGAMALPKGHIEGGEAPIHAALRELFEETGAKSAVLPFEFFRIRPVAHVLPDELVMKALLYYRIHAEELPPINANKAAWVPIAELPSVHFVDDYIRDMLGAL
jgi:8-oxo-dGTP pyrophosphatase MutT (NUDIX family)